MHENNFFPHVWFFLIYFSLTIVKVKLGARNIDYVQKRGDLIKFNLILQ